MRTMQFTTTVEPLRTDDETPATEVLQKINDTVRRVWPEEESFSFIFWGTNPEGISVYEQAKRGEAFWKLIGNGRMIVYCVEGSSEGHYVHFDMHSPMSEKGGGEYRAIMMLKCFGGLERAQQIANLVQFLLGC